MIHQVNPEAYPELFKRSGLGIILSKGKDLG